MSTEILNVSTIKELDHYIDLLTERQYTGCVQFSSSMRNLFDLFSEAKKLSNLNRFQEALQLFKQLTELAPTFENAHLQYGISLLSCGRLTESLDEINQAKAINPEDYNVYLLLGAIFSAMGNKLAEIKEYKKALDVNPNSWDAMNNLGITFREIHDFDNSLKWFSSAVELIYKNHLGNYRLAITLYGMGETYESMKLLRETVSVLEDGLNAAYLARQDIPIFNSFEQTFVITSSILRKLSFVCYRYNYIDKSKNYLKRYLELCPDDYEARSLWVKVN